MIQVYADNDVDRRVRTVFVCDLCRRPIEETSNGAALFFNQGDGDSLQVFHVHKGRCDDQLPIQLGVDAASSWDELRDHYINVAASMDINIRRLINIDADSSERLSAETRSDLQDLISQLHNWLCEHGVVSRLGG